MKKVYLISDTSFPLGFAATNRTLSYAQGFKENGVEAEIIVFRKTENPDQIRNTQREGLHGGIKYHYLFSSPVKSRLFIKRRLDNCSGLLRLFFLSLKDFNKNVIIIYYSKYIIPVFILKVVKTIKKFILVKEENEHPAVYLARMNLLQKYCFLYFHFQLFDALLAMTHNLFEYFNKKYSSMPILHVPMTVDVDRFPLKETTPQKIITYIGSLNNKKDGILILLDAMVSVTKDYTDYKLAIYGFESNKSEIAKVKEKIAGLNLTKTVALNEPVPGGQIPEILSQSALLVLPRPDSLQARNGFPTKLGEYLASARPVVTTCVGEIPLYLSDNVNVFLAKPGDVTSLSEKIIQALSDESCAKKVGLNGRKIALRFFNNQVQTKSIINFVGKLN